MSPRSAEFLAAARTRLATARGAAGSDPASTVSLAHHAMFYAARAALSERDRYARTHRGTWQLFGEVFPGFDAMLLGESRRAQPKREEADYEAWVPTAEQAGAALDVAGRFLAAVERLIADLD